MTLTLSADWDEGMHILLFRGVLEIFLSESLISHSASIEVGLIYFSCANINYLVHVLVTFLPTKSSSRHKVTQVFNIMYQVFNIMGRPEFKIWQ